jgi:hypothetical protein
VIGWFLKARNLAEFAFELGDPRAELLVFTLKRVSCRFCSTHAGSLGQEIYKYSVPPRACQAFLVPECTGSDAVLPITEPVR